MVALINHLLTYLLTYLYRSVQYLTHGVYYLENVYVFFIKKMSKLKFKIKIT